MACLGSVVGQEAASASASVGNARSVRCDAKTALRSIQGGVLGHIVGEAKAIRIENEVGVFVAQFGAL